METPVLEAKRREITGKRIRALRNQGLLPAIMYGSGIEPQPLELDQLEANKVLIRSSGSTLIELNIEKDIHHVLVREIQRDVIRRNILHVDFLKVAMDVKIKAEVPIEFVGEAPAIKNLGGVLVPGINMIEVEALPNDLINSVPVDLTVLEEIDDTITVADLEVDEAISILTEAEEVIARIVYQVEEELEEEVEEEEELELDVEPEVIERGKKEEEDEETVTDEE
jgi:large subunit ribosomal protein L25